MNKRKRTRVAARKDATVVWPGGEVMGELRDLSLKGCYVASPVGGEVHQGQEVVVVIHLEPEAPELDVRVHGSVVRQEAAGVAVDFTEIELESFRHLFRLVQYNAPDPDGIEEELGESAFTPAADESR